ncbi:MAG TPA: hypothetical protein VN690_09440 [Terriglobales bacterium]|nr:hypothetical protein [Terriglobales bacterium]
MPKLLRILLALLVFAAVFYVLYASLHTAKYRVEVCLEYQGRSSCRIAEGRTQDEALRAAHDNACAQITSGVTGTLGCQNTPSTSVQWLTK